MRAFTNGRVAVSEQDLYDFMRQWPCSGLDGLRGVTFMYESNGDLVDIYYKNGSSDDWDGPALLALSEDAQEYLEGARDPQVRRELRAQYNSPGGGGLPWWWPASWGT